MRVLVTGGAGYIGSHTARLLSESGREVVVLDSLVKGHRAAIGSLSLIQADVRDAVFLAQIFERERFDAVVHFAAFIEMGESVADPLKYYLNNLAGGLTLLEAAVRSGVLRFVFSSSAGVYGTPSRVPITEDMPANPINPYGQTKRDFEVALEYSRRAYGLSYASLRYFNAAGAHPDATMGEDHRPESHLIPSIFLEAMKGSPVSVFGTDYPTPDGTCVRDYIHVLDLARAHVLALDALKDAPGEGHVLNLGNGAGFSVREIIDKVAEISGLAIDVKETPRRPGDAPVLVASSEKARRLLGWQSQYADIDTIISTAWRWHSTHQNGYGD